MIPIRVNEKVDWKSKLASDVTFQIKPLTPEVRARIEDTVTEIKGKVVEDMIPEVKINIFLARLLYVQFGLAGWQWVYDGKPVEFRLKPYSKWGKDYEIASDESIALLQRSNMDIYNELADAIRDNSYLQEQEAKNSDSPSPVLSTDSVVNPV